MPTIHAATLRVLRATGHARVMPLLGLLALLLAACGPGGSRAGY
jgi:hypothetical protein